MYISGWSHGAGNASLVVEHDLVRAIKRCLTWLLGYVTFTGGAKVVARSKQSRTCSPSPAQLSTIFPGIENALKPPLLQVCFSHLQSSIDPTDIQ